MTTPTILHDLESLAECLEYCIKEQVREKHKYKLVFKHGIALSELTQFLYGQSYFLKFCKENEGSDYLPGECLFHTEKQLELEGDLLIITAQNVYLRDDPWFQETIRKKLVQRMIPDLKRRKPSRINV